MVCSIVEWSCKEKFQFRQQLSHLDFADLFQIFCAMIINISMSGQYLDKQMEPFGLLWCWVAGMVKDNNTVVEAVNNIVSSFNMPKCRGTRALLD